MRYVYAVIPADRLPQGTSPAGVDDAAVRYVEGGAFAAIVSDVDEQTYSTDGVEQLTGDASRLGERAAAHDRVVTWASDRAPTVPLPLLSLFRNDERITDMLREREVTLRSALDRIARGREYTLRLYRVDDMLQQSLADLSSDIAAREAALQSASPGQRYLMERKLEKERQSAVRQVGRDVAAEVWTALRGVALDAVSEAAPRGASAEVPLVLNASFLVSHEGYDEFRRVLTSFVERYATRGFRFDFTGPWPAYHFAGPANRGAAAHG